MLIKIFNFIIAYLIIAILTDLYLIHKIGHDIFDTIERKYNHKMSELQIVLGWPIFWAGYILALIFDLKD